MGDSTLEMFNFASAGDKIFIYNTKNFNKERSELSMNGHAATQKHYTA